MCINYNSFTTRLQFCKRVANELCICDAIHFYNSVPFTFAYEHVYIHIYTYSYGNSNTCRTLYNDHELQMHVFCKRARDAYTMCKRLGPYIQTNCMHSMWYVVRGLIELETQCDFCVVNSNWLLSRLIYNSFAILQMSCK